MYKVNVKEKLLTKLDNTDFVTHNLLERYDIQEWIEKTPEVLGEELLNFGKELCLQNGSRLDLIAIDKNANIVVVEIKRQASGKEIDWQAIKYASYCSSFLVEEIVRHYSNYLTSDEEEARSKIEEFLDENIDLLNGKQRIILVSQDFHSDVLSAVLWLRDYGIDIECLRFRPFIDENEQLYVHPEKIIPLPEAKDYILKKERKQREIKSRDITIVDGKILDELYVSIQSGKYRIERYDSTTIKVFDLKNEAYIVAKPILRKVNQELELNVNLKNKKGNNKNTRSLGKDIIVELKKQNKNITEQDI